MMHTVQQHDGYLTGQCLVAMPSMGDPRFEGAVIYICAHTEEGAMGIVINRPMQEISFPDIVDQLGIEPTAHCEQIRVQFGGPVETMRGFVLHTRDYENEGTLFVDDSTALTATLDVLRAIAEGQGPGRAIMALGYAGWGAGQLDGELKENVWLTVPADRRLLFETALEDKYNAAMARLGIDPRLLSEDAGHA
ncbi:YqgE/AlgH family protein [Rhodospirillum sp. A1_3_36]|uniref:YqgE/AlgH family protein n=1 Tax=Rhodospirillum sp. A1_3_36 TaxID=3391666 RepID=UPI0039A725A1